MKERIGDFLGTISRGDDEGVDSTVGELIRLSEEIKRGMADADKYRRVPEAMRSFFESEGQATIAASLRLLESANARIQVEMIERRLREVGPAPECDDCVLKNALESIQRVLSHSYLNLAP